MFAAESLRDWRGHTVIDPEGHKIGTLEAVYVDTASDEPCFITVKVGMMSRHRMVFVPWLVPQSRRKQYGCNTPRDWSRTPRRPTPMESWPPQLSRRCSRTTTLTMAAGRSGDSPASKRPSGSMGRKVPFAATARGLASCLAVVSAEDLGGHRLLHRRRRSAAGAPRVPMRDHIRWRALRYPPAGQPMVQLQFPNATACQLVKHCLS